MQTGCIHIYYGDGKGKTTAAVGQAVRAAGYGYKVLFYQFMKNNSSSERKSLEALSNITCIEGREQVKFTFQMDADEKEEMRKYYKKELELLRKQAEEYDVLVLDEAVCAVGAGMLQEEDLLSFLKNKGENVEIILTGHTITSNLLEVADYVTEMKKVKHPFDRGIGARKGIEM
ncbi:cob(I)yrinic acid a,c-diamide adenosyltransferase [Faecalimonas sp.]